MEVAIEAARAETAEARTDDWSEKLLDRCSKAAEGAWPGAEDADPDAVIRILRERLEARVGEAVMPDDILSDEDFRHLMDSHHEEALRLARQMLWPEIYGEPS
jgi:hypothetical protein